MSTLSGQKREHSTKRQQFFLRTNWLRRWVLIVGEGVAVISGCIYFVPILPEFIHNIAIPVAVLSGAIALLSIAIYDKLDPTTVRLCRVDDEAHHDVLDKRGETQQDVMYWWPEKTS